MIRISTCVPSFHARSGHRVAYDDLDRCPRCVHRPGDQRRADRAFVDSAADAVSRLPPGMRLELRQHPDVAPEIEPRVRFEINPDGERGGEDPPGDDVCRILVAGGSAAECYALDQPTSWPGVLQRLLNEDDALRALGARRVHVGNIARSGVSSPEL